MKSWFFLFPGSSNEEPSDGNDIVSQRMRVFQKFSVLKEKLKLRKFEKSSCNVAELVRKRNVEQAEKIQDTLNVSLITTSVTNKRVC